MRELSERYGLAVDPTARIERISVGQQQRVEILKALYRGAEILILDEPTAVLTPQEADELFAIIRSLTGGGEVDHLHHPQAGRGARRSPTGSPSSAAGSRRDGPAGGGDARKGSRG